MPDMPEPDLDAEWKTWSMDRSPQANSKMLKSLDPVINNAVSVHIGDADPIAKSKARAMTLQALGTYNPSRGRLQSHIYSHLRGLKRYNAQRSQGVNIPERVSLDRRAINMASQELQDELGREPTEDELVDHSGFSARRIKHVRSFNPGFNTGQLSSAGEDGSAFDPAIKGPQSTSWADLIKMDLAPVDQKIMEYAQQAMDNRLIASKLRLSPGRVSQRKLAIQQLLDQESENGL